MPVGDVVMNRNYGSNICKNNHLKKKYSFPAFITLRMFDPNLLEHHFYLTILEIYN